MMANRFMQSSNVIVECGQKGTTMLNAIRQFVKEEEGASAAEYALILAIISLGIVVAMQGLGTAITGAVTTAANTITSSGS